MGTGFNFSVIGGDRRQIKLIHLLLDKGHRVNILGFDNFSDCRANLYTEIHPELFNCHILFLPIPYKDRDGNINMKKSDIKVNLINIGENIDKYRPFFVLGKADNDFIDLALKKNLDYIDITKEETFAILNAIPTAEGAIKKAMEMTDITIHGSRVLVLGYGRIGKTLSRMLKGIGAEVTVEARNGKDLAWIMENGYEPVHIKDLEQVLSYQDIVFNTIPYLILDKDKLQRMNKNAVIIDVSSYPGGLDFHAAKEMGIKTSLDLGLPGVVAPKTAAEIIYKVTMDSLSER